LGKQYVRQTGARPILYPLVVRGAAPTFRTKLAEGVVSEPLLSSGDQGRKGGFATLQKQPPIALGITNEIPYENRLYYGNLGCKAGRELGNAQKLGMLPNQTRQAILVENPRIG
jgi:hypothetical protein